MKRRKLARRQIWRVMQRRIQWISGETHIKSIVYNYQTMINNTFQRINKKLTTLRYLEENRAQRRLAVKSSQAVAKKPDKGYKYLHRHI